MYRTKSPRGGFVLVYPVLILAPDFPLPGSYILILMGRVKRYIFKAASSTSSTAYGAREPVLLTAPPNQLLLILYAVNREAASPRAISPNCII